MTTLYIAEFSALYNAGGITGPMARQPPITEQTVAIGGSSAASNAFNAATNFVRLHADSICSVEFGTSPTATTTTARMAANQTEYFAVAQGGLQKVAVITNT